MLLRRHDASPSKLLPPFLLGFVSSLVLDLLLMAKSVLIHHNRGQRRIMNMIFK